MNLWVERLWEEMLVVTFQRAYCDSNLEEKRKCFPLEFKRNFLISSILAFSSGLRGLGSGMIRLLLPFGS
jgi:hypothetical protein